MIPVLMYIGSFLGIFVYAVHLIALLRAKTHLFKEKYKIKEIHSEPVGVSVVKTLVSFSPKVIENLESVFCIKYPKFEIKICVQDSSSSVIPHIKDLMHRYPNVDAELYSGAMDIGVNPKINNMLQCYDHLKYNYVWICDSNIKVHEHTLDKVSMHLREEVGLIHHLPYYINSAQGYGATLEKVYFGAHHARWYLFFNSLGILCANGMSSIFNKQLLDQYGGLIALSNYIAEDYFMGKTLYDHGHKIVLTTEPCYQNPDHASYSSFVKRMTRWQILRLTMLPFGFFEPIIECLCVGLFIAYSLHSVFEIPFLICYIIHVMVWFTLDQMLLRIIDGKLPPFKEQVVGWVFREVVTFYVYFSAVFNRKIGWHKGTFNVSFGGNSKFVPKIDVKRY